MKKMTISHHSGHRVLDLLTRLDRCELADNRMTLYAPGFGLGSLHYWDGSWNNDEDLNPRQMREVFENRDGFLEIALPGGPSEVLHPDLRQWQPHEMRTRLVGPRQSVWEERKTVADDVAVDMVTVKGGGLKPWQLLVRHFIVREDHLEVAAVPEGVHLFQRTGRYEGIHRFIGFAGKGKTGLRKVAGGWMLEHELTIEPEKSLSFAFAVGAGEDAAEAARRWRSALRAPGKSLSTARQKWEDFFDRHVPDFRCDQPRWEKLFYFSLYVLRVNLYDFRKGAIRHPYSCPSKWRLLPSWFWDPCFHGFSEKWLKDYPAPISSFRNHFGVQDELGYLPMTVDTRGDTWKAMRVMERPCQQFVHPLTVWDHYLVHGDREILRECLGPMLRHADYIAAHRQPGKEGLFVPNNGAELADNSSRLVADPSDRSSIDTLHRQIQPVDWNSFLLVAERLLGRMAGELGDSATASRMSGRADARQASLRKLWNQKTGMFTDRVLPSGTLSPKRFPESFLSMLGGYPTRAQAASMARHLLDEDRFWTRYPVPTLPLDDPAFTVEDVYESYWNGRVWPNLNWGIIEGLNRCGRGREAGLLLERTLEMFVATGEAECTENYHPLEPVRYSPPHNIFNYGWGALGADLILRRGLGIQCHAPSNEVAVSPLGLPGVTEASVAGVPLGKGEFSVRVSFRKGGAQASVSGAKRAKAAIHWLDL